MAKLLILTGKHQGKRLTLPDREVIIGRSEECNITLKTDEVSRKHCRITVHEGHMSVRDLGSRNGTLVNGKAISDEVPLHDGDELQIGPMRFRVQMDSPAPAAPADVTPATTSESQAQADEDNIASWLAGSPDDTHTIKATTEEDTAIHAVASPSPKKVFASVAEEAQDIIRRHLEQKSGQTPS